MPTRFSRTCKVTFYPEESGECYNPPHLQVVLVLNLIYASLPSTTAEDGQPLRRGGLGARMKWWKTTAAAAKAEGLSQWWEADSKAARGGTREKTCGSPICSLTKRVYEWVLVSLWIQNVHNNRCHVSNEGSCGATKSDSVPCGSSSELS